jgi:tRNA (cytidine/uridine-2'-O-)-methyltransferase
MAEDQEQTDATGLGAGGPVGPADGDAAGDSFLVPDPVTQPHSPPLAHVVLYQPQIPQNTGNIGRTCVATGSVLWIVQPAAFQIDEKRVRRAGLDYWQHLQLNEVASWEHLRERLPQKRYWYFSRFAEQTIWEADFQAGDVIVFGSETTGLPRSIMQPASADAVRLPTDPRVRSLNLSSTAAIVLYEMMRRRDAVS